MGNPVFSQASRAVQISSPFGADTLLVGELSGSERLSQLFQFDLRLFSERGDLDPDAVLGKPVTVTVKVGEQGTPRHFHGLVTDFSLSGYNERLHEYHATVRPWFWFLTRTADCRIYQGRTVPEIFQDVCRQAGFSDFRLSLAGSYEPWDYCVQYRETDFAFLNRLLEQEGIFYFFEHSKDKHVLVLCDDVASLAPVSGYESVPYFPPTGAETRRERDHLSVLGVPEIVPAGHVRHARLRFQNSHAAAGRDRQHLASLRQGELRDLRVSGRSGYAEGRRARREGTHPGAADRTAGGAW